MSEKKAPVGLALVLTVALAWREAGGDGAVARGAWVVQPAAGDRRRIMRPKFLRYAYLTGYDGRFSLEGERTFAQMVLGADSGRREENSR